jgi:YaiO family outer membrane protein
MITLSNSSRITLEAGLLGLISFIACLSILSMAEAGDTRTSEELMRAMDAARASGAVETETQAPGPPVQEKPSENDKKTLEQAMKSAEHSGAVEIGQPATKPLASPLLLPRERKNRLDIAGTYEYLHPHGTYGDWGNITATLYRKERPDLTWFVQLGAHSRKDGEGMLVSAGVYKDWTESIFTYTALTAGTNSAYLPQFRADQDFNLRIGPEKNFVWVVGGTYIQYFDVHRDYIVSTGFSAYLGRWVAEYRIFRNISDPGSETSYSHAFGLSYGEDGWQWSYVKFSFGRQAYQATNLETPEAVNNNSMLATVGHRRWIGKDYGVFGEASWFKLSHAYQKYGITIGFFKEF